MLKNDEDKIKKAFNMFDVYRNKAFKMYLKLAFKMH